MSSLSAAYSWSSAACLLSSWTCTFSTSDELDRVAYFGLLIIKTYDFIKVATSADKTRKLFDVIKYSQGDLMSMVKKLLRSCLLISWRT